VEGGAEELDPAGAMASMESRMETRKSGLARRGSGGDDGRRGYRYPSGRYRHWPGTAASVGNGGVGGERRGGAGVLPVGLALP